MHPPCLAKNNEEDLGVGPLDRGTERAHSAQWRAGVLQGEAVTSTVTMPHLAKRKLPSPPTSPLASGSSGHEVLLGDMAACHVIQGGLDDVSERLDNSVAAPRDRVGAISVVPDPSPVAELSQVHSGKSPPSGVVDCCENTVEGNLSRISPAISLSEVRVTSDLDLCAGNLAAVVLTPFMGGSHGEKKVWQQRPQKRVHLDDDPPGHVEGRPLDPKDNPTTGSLNLLSDSLGSHPEGRDIGKRARLAPGGRGVPFPTKTCHPGVRSEPNKYAHVEETAPDPTTPQTSGSEQDSQQGQGYRLHGAHPGKEGTNAQIDLELGAKVNATTAHPNLLSDSQGSFPEGRDIGEHALLATDGSTTTFPVPTCHPGVRSEPNKYAPVEETATDPMTSQTSGSEQDSRMGHGYRPHGAHPEKEGTNAQSGLELVAKDNPAMGNPNMASPTSCELPDKSCMQEGGLCSKGAPNPESLKSACTSGDVARVPDDRFAPNHLEKLSHLASSVLTPLLVGSDSEKRVCQTGVPKSRDHQTGGPDMSHDIQPMLLEPRSTNMLSDSDGRSADDRHLGKGDLEVPNSPPTAMATTAATERQMISTSQNPGLLPLASTHMQQRCRGEIISPPPQIAFVELSVLPCESLKIKTFGELKFSMGTRDVRTESLSSIPFSELSSDVPVLSYGAGSALELNSLSQPTEKGGDDAITPASLAATSDTDTVPDNLIAHQVRPDGVYTMVPVTGLSDHSGQKVSNTSQSRKENDPNCVPENTEVVSSPAQPLAGETEKPSVRQSLPLGMVDVVPPVQASSEADQHQPSLVVCTAELDERASTTAVALNSAMQPSHDMLSLDRNEAHTTAHAKTPTDTQGSANLAPNVVVEFPTNQNGPTLTVTSVVTVTTPEGALTVALQPPNASVSTATQLPELPHVASEAQLQEELTSQPISSQTAAADANPQSIDFAGELNTLLGPSTRDPGFICTLCKQPRSAESFAGLLSHIRKCHKAVTAFPHEMGVAKCAHCPRLCDAQKSVGQACSHCSHRKKSRDQAHAPHKASSKPTAVSTDAARTTSAAVKVSTAPAVSSICEDDYGPDNHDLENDEELSWHTGSPKKKRPSSASPQHASKRRVQDVASSPESDAWGPRKRPAPESPLNAPPSKAKATAAIVAPVMAVTQQQFQAGANQNAPQSDSPIVASTTSPSYAAVASVAVPAPRALTALSAPSASPAPPAPPAPPVPKRVSAKAVSTTWSPAPMVTAKDPVPPAHSTSSAAGASQAPPVSSAASAPPKGTKRASAAIRVPPAPVGPRSCCSTQFPSESALLAHLRTSHSVGGLVHLSQEKLVSFGLAQCDACLQVLMPGSASHPRNCVALEAGADAAIMRAAFQKCLRSGLLVTAAASTMPAKLGSMSWAAITAHVIVPFTKFPGSPAIRACWREVFLAATKPLLAANPPESAWKLFALLPWLLFQRSAVRPAPTAAKLIQGRFQLFLAAKWDDLISAAQDNEAQWLLLFSQPRSTAPDPEAKRIARVQALAALGDISRAANILASSASVLDPSTDGQVASKVRSLLVTKPYPPRVDSEAAATAANLTFLSEFMAGASTSSVSAPVDVPSSTTPPDPVAFVLPAGMGISPAEARSAMSHTGTSSAGPTGWHISCLKVLTSEQSCVDRIAAILSLLLSAAMPAQCLELFSSGALTVLSKDNGGVRPIVTRSTWVRLLSKAIVAKEQPALSRPLAPLQCGVGMQGGAEFIVHSVRHMLSVQPTWTLTTIDAANAYGTVSRSAIRRQLCDAMAPHDFTLAYFDRFCAPRFSISHGRSFKVSVAEGVIQGDPLSPLLFALALQPALVKTDQVLKPQVDSARVFAYLDDVCILAPAPVTASVFTTFRSTAAQVGLLINQSKTMLFTPAMVSVTNIPADITSLQSAIGGRVAFPTTGLLGSVLCRDEAVASVCDTPASIDDDNKLFRRLDSVPSLQLRLLLLRISISRAYLHRLRTSPPSQTGVMAARVDGKIARSLSLLCGGDDREQLSALTLKEALLPAAVGGLGVPCLTDIRLAAHVASVLATVQQWRKYTTDDSALLSSWAASPSLTALLASLQPTIQSASVALNDTLLFPVSSHDALVFSCTNKLQKRLLEFVDINAVTLIKQQSLTTNLARAQYLSKTARGARAFLQACPTDAGLRLSNDDMVLSLRLWLRLPLLPMFDAPPAITCFCNPSTLLSEEHILNCNGIAARDVRHNTLALCFQEMLQAAVTSPVLMEPRASNKANVHYRFDIAVAAYDANSKNLKLDVTVRNPQAKTMVVRAAAKALVACDEAVAHKHKKYAEFLAPNDKFMPLAMEPFGGMHDNIFDLVSGCAQRVGNLPPDSSCFLAPSFSTYWLQRLSCTLMRENSRLINVIVGSSVRNYGVQDDDAPAGLLTTLLAVGAPTTSEWSGPSTVTSSD